MRLLQHSDELITATSSRRSLLRSLGRNGAVKRFHNHGCNHPKRFSLVNLCQSELRLDVVSHFDIREHNNNSRFVIVVSRQVLIRVRKNTSRLPLRKHCVLDLLIIFGPVPLLLVLYRIGAELSPSCWNWKHTSFWS